MRWKPGLDAEHELGAGSTASGSGAFFVEGLSQQLCHSAAQALQVFYRSPDTCVSRLSVCRGLRQRTVAAGTINAASSRSHSVFSLEVQRKDVDPAQCWTSRLHLVRTPVRSTSLLLDPPEPRRWT